MTPSRLVDVSYDEVRRDHSNWSERAVDREVAMRLGKKADTVRKMHQRHKKKYENEDDAFKKKKNRVLSDVQEWTLAGVAAAASKASGPLTEAMVIRLAADICHKKTLSRSWARQFLMRNADVLRKAKSTKATNQARIDQSTYKVVMEWMKDAEDTLGEDGQNYGAHRIVHFDETICILVEI
jgi:hypothetical protein